jgi:hypothetical protein
MLNGFRNTILFLLAFSCLASCVKQDNPDIATGLLLKSVTYTYIPDAISTKYEYRYDNMGRLVSVAPAGTNAPPLRMPIEYNGNIVTLRQVDGNPNVTRVITFILRPDGKPGQRIVAERYSLDTLGETRNQFDADTTWFNYDAAGILQSTRFARRDSGYTLSGNEFLQVQKWNALTEYIMSDSNVTQVKVFADYSGRSWLNGQELSPEKGSQRVTLDVQYNSQWTYPDFGINDFLIREGWSNGISSWMRWATSRHYPSYTKVTDEYLGPNGDVVRRHVEEIKNYQASFTPEGRLSRFTYLFDQGRKTQVDYEYGQ